MVKKFACQRRIFWFGKHLDWEAALEKEMATHSSVQPGKSHRGGWQATVNPWGLKRVGHSSATQQLLGILSPPPSLPFLQTLLLCHFLREAFPDFFFFFFSLTSYPRLGKAPLVCNLPLSFCLPYCTGLLFH